MAIDRFKVPSARDYLHEIGSYERGEGSYRRWFCPFCHDYSLTISRNDRISCDNGCVWGVGVIGFQAYRYDCSEADAARQLGCWVYERPVHP